jgi:hypothetical protein
MYRGGETWGVMGTEVMILACPPGVATMKVKSVVIALVEIGLGDVV